MTIAPGRYPVSLSVARTRTDPPVTVVCGARIQVSDDPVGRWTPAREKVADDGSVTAQGFVVDRGLACLLDDDPIPIVTRLNHDEDAFERFANGLLSSTGNWRTSPRALTSSPWSVGWGMVRIPCG